MKKSLADILYKVKLRSITGDRNRDIESVCIDSRMVKPGALFIAVRGTHADGHDFIEKAVSAGAVALLVEAIPPGANQDLTWIEVENSAEAAGQIAHLFYGEPSLKMKVVGVTGTNGKTTIATLLYKLFTSLGHPSGLISTVENIIGTSKMQSTHTTPDAIQLQALLAEMRDAGCTHVFMEVSSHAVHQHRVSGLVFAGGIFSNITHDHLDYHKTFDEYIRVKKSFFDDLPGSAFAITNLDDKRGNVMLQNTKARKLSYSLKTMADFKGKILQNDLTGLVMMVNDQEVHFRMIGEFNAYNLLAVYGAAVTMGEDKQEVLTQLSIATGAEGRFDYQVSDKDRLLVIVDYAHTPDALLNVLMTIKKLRKGFEQVITVVGCGGDRDKTKRPVMAEVACEHSDKAIFTSDNPRSEDPMSIIRDMENGLGAAAKRKYLVVPDRKEAIKTAISIAEPQAIILVAGKGHEKYQEIKGVRNHFDDKEVVREMLELLER